MATYAELIRLDLRVMELEQRFAHMHVNNGVDDSCKVCRFDLRDPIHKRVDP